MPMPMPMSEALELRRQKCELTGCHCGDKADDKVILDENPTLHEDSLPLPGDLAHDDLPPLALSTNPLYPNAIVKRPPNTHAKSAQRSKPAAVVVPKNTVVTGKNAPVS